MNAIKTVEPTFAPGVLDLLRGQNFLEVFRAHVALIQTYFPEMRRLDVGARADPDLPGRHWVEVEVTVPPQNHEDVVSRRRAAITEILERYPDRMVIAIIPRVTEAPE